ASYIDSPSADERYEALKGELLARWGAEADAALAEVAAWREPDALPRAVARAQCARADFAPLEVAKKLDTVLLEMKKDARYAAAYDAFVPRLAWRREVIRTLEVEAKAREQTALKKRGGWASLWSTFDALIRRAPDEALRSALSAHMTAVRAEVG